MKTGGYQIIDLEGKDIGSVSVTINGIYDKIESTRKPLLVSGLVVDGKEFHDFFAFCQEDATTFYLYFPFFGSGDYTSSYISVESDDTVTFTTL